MNFRDWEKLEENDKTVTLRHPKGHQMTIAVKALPKIQQEMIKRLKFAKGGDVLDSGEGGESEQGRTVRHANKTKSKEEMSHAKEEAKGRMEMGRMVKPKMKGLAHGGEVKYKDPDLAKKGEASLKAKHEASAPERERGAAFFKEADRELKHRNGSGFKKEYYDEGTPDGPIQDDQSQSDQNTQPATSHTPITINVGTPAQAPIANQYVPPTAPPKVTVPEPTPVQGSSLSNEARNTLEGVEAGKAGIKGQAMVDAAKAQAMVPATEQALNTEQALAEQNSKAYQEIAQHTNDFRDYINKNPIDNNHFAKTYQENASSGQKVMTALGLIAGGLGTPFGGHNYAFDFLNKQIDRDIDAQKARSEQQRTVLGAYQSLYGDNNISTALAKASMNDIYAKKLQLVGQQLGTPQAQINANMNIQKLNTESEALRQNAAALLGSGRATKGAATAHPPGGGAPAQGPKQYKDQDLRPGSAQAPEAPPPKQIGINYDEFKRSQMLGAKGVPGYITPGEVGEANRAIDYVNSLNQVMREIHNQYGEMWKHGGQADILTTGLEGASVGPVHVPNVGKMFAGQDMKGYYRARAAITKQLGNLMKGGLSPEVADQIKAQMTQRRDTPNDYRSQLENVDNLLMQSVPAGVLKKYNLAKGLPE